VRIPRGRRRPLRQGARQAVRAASVRRAACYPNRVEEGTGG